MRAFKCTSTESQRYHDIRSGSLFVRLLTILRTLYYMPLWPPLRGSLEMQVETLRNKNL